MQFLAGNGYKKWKFAVRTGTGISLSLHFGLARSESARKYFKLYWMAIIAGVSETVLLVSHYPFLSST